MTVMANMAMAVMAVTAKTVVAGTDITAMANMAMAVMAVSAMQMLPSARVQVHAYEGLASRPATVVTARRARYTAMFP